MAYSEMSHDEFLKGRVAEWRRHCARDRMPFGILEYLGMTADEYADWFLTGVVALRVLRVWKR